MDINLVEGKDNQIMAMVNDRKFTKLVWNGEEIKDIIIRGPNGVRSRGCLYFTNVWELEWEVVK